MTTGVKIAIGCGVALILGIMVVAAGIFGGAYWLKGKADEFTGNESKIEELQQKANANSFERPEDGIIREDRFVKFLDVRKRVFSVYEKHRGTLETMNKKKQGDWGDVTSGFSIVNEIRMAQAQALADAGMSENEYQFMVEQVYKSAWASEVAKSTGGKSISEASSEMFAKAAEEMEKARQAARTASPGTGADGEAAEDADESMEEGAAEMRKRAEEMRNSAQEMDVPKENIALFQKYEAEIKKYAMGGLEWIGL